MVLRKSMELGRVIVVSVILVIATWFTLEGSRMFGIWVLTMTLAPLLMAVASRIQLVSLIPDMVFGAMDTGLLTVAAIIGASWFGIIGAIVGGVVGDAITDGIAGFFEGGIAEWMRSKGIEESRTALGSALGKMTGCLAGSGVVLVIVAIFGLEISQI